MSNHYIFSFLLLVLFNIITCPMAKNIYSDPDLSQTSRKFDAFTIDFKGIETPQSTYWALCNFQVDLTEFKKTHNEVTGGGAYGGLQTRISDKVAILSFWDIHYKENEIDTIITPNRVYPYGDESSFGGEGNGNHYLGYYNWVSNDWYRFVIKSWKDETTGNTFIGEWVGELTTGIWTLITYFNTNLKNTYITGGMSQFQENYNELYFGSERSFNFKNIYVSDIEKNSWISINTSTLSYDPASWGFNTAGTHEFGFNETYFYGSSGLPVDDQQKYDKDNPMRLTGTISQPNSLSKGKIKSTMDFNITSSLISVKWTVDKTSTPVYKYRIIVYKITNAELTLVHDIFITRPELTEYTYNSSFSGNYKVVVYFYGIFGEFTTSILNKECS